MATDTFPKTALRVIAALAAIAFLCSGYLLYQKLSGNYDTCCGHVLDTPWSAWFGVPVSVFACLLYSVILVGAVPRIASSKPAASSIILRGGATLAAGAALWFCVVLLFIERTSCPYCIATHICGFSIAITVFSIRRSLSATSSLPYAVAAVGLVAMIAGHLMNRSEATLSGPSTPPSQQAGASPDEIVFTNQIKLRLGQFPSIGPAQPKHYVAEIFDYTCKSCREMHGDLQALKKAHPDTFSVIYVPAPLNRGCNVFLPPAVHDHQHACELARTSLAVWNADQASFAEIHDYLMNTPLPISPSDAEAKAISLVGADAYRQALASPAVSGAMTTAFGHYASSIQRSIKMPKLLVGGGKMMEGLAPKTEAFVSLMTKHFGLE